MIDNKHSGNQSIYILHPDAAHDQLIGAFSRACNQPLEVEPSVEKRKQFVDGRLSLGIRRFLVAATIVFLAASSVYAFANLTKVSEQLERTSVKVEQEKIASRKSKQQLVSLEVERTKLVRAAGEENARLFLSRPRLPLNDSDESPVIDVRNALFACKINGQLVYSDSTIPLEIGQASIMVEPYWPSEFLQPFRLELNSPRGLFGTSLGKVEFPVAKGDVVRLYLEQPSPPWNAVIVRHKKGQLLVSCHSPQHGYNLRKYLEGKLDRLPNAAFVVAKNGVESTANQIAEFVLSGESGDHFGAFKPKNLGFRVVFPIDNEKTIAEPFKSLNKAELARLIQNGIELVLQNRIPHTNSIQHEVDSAKRILKRLESNPDETKKQLLNQLPR